MLSAFRMSTCTPAAACEYAPGAAVAVASSCSTSAAVPSAAAGSAAFVVVAAVDVGVILQLLRCLSGTASFCDLRHTHTPPVSYVDTYVS